MKKIFRFLLNTFFIIIFLHFFSIKVLSQPALPARTITVNSTQALSFGTFCLSNSASNGGNVIVGWDGSRSSSGDIILLNSSPSHSAAIFEINLCQGRNVIITYSPTTTLSGSNGGSLTLDIGPTEKGESGSSFPVSDNCQFITQLRVGGTLEVGSNGSNPKGTYSGSFTITFNQE